jgi:hypothetical protein
MSARSPDDQARAATGEDLYRNNVKNTDRVPEGGRKLLVEAGLETVVRGNGTGPAARALGLRRQLEERRP